MLIASRDTDDNGAKLSKDKVIYLMARVVIIFVFGTTTTLFALQVFRCAIGNECRPIDGLSHLLFAWVGAILGGVLGYLLGSSLRRNGHNGSSHVG